MKTILKFVGLALAVLVVAIIWFGYSVLSDMCGNTIIESVASPDGKRKAVLFERDCGATTGFSSQITLLNSEEELENEPGNVYIADGYPNGYTLSWESNNILVIGGSVSQPNMNEGHISGVQIHYE